MRRLAAGDHDRALRVWRWPLREALHSLRFVVRHEEAEAYDFSVLIHTLRMPWVKQRERPPDEPMWMKKERIKRAGGITDG